MTRFLFLLFSTLLFAIFEHASSFNITHNTSLPSHRRRMPEPATLATIAAIATITSAALEVADTAIGAINVYGASIGIDNFFKYVDLELVGKKVMDGEQSKPEHDTIFGSISGASGGVFSDEEWSAGDGSAGIIRYRATNPITSSKIYCFDYFWSSQSYKVGYIVGIGPHLTSRYLPGGIAIVISSERCNRDITTSFNDIKTFWVNKVKNSNNGNWDYQYTGYWSSSDNGGSGNDAMIALTNRAQQDEIKIGSDDFRVAMSASMTNNDKTAIAIGIGPYKQIYGDDLYNQNDWFVFFQDHECLGGDERLGQFGNVRECFKACQNTKNTDCNFLIFGKKSKYGYCYWESTASCNNFEDDYYAIINVGGPDYQLWEYGVDCISGDEELLGNFDTVDECAAKCKSQKGSNCEFFAFGIDNNIGSCWWEESCTKTESDKYNVYVIKEYSDVFDSKSIWKRKSIDFPGDFASKQNIDLFWDVRVYGLLTLVVIISVIGCVIAFICCIMVGNDNKTKIVSYP